MKNSKLSIKDIVTQIVFLAIGIGLFWYVFKDFDVNEIKSIILNTSVLPIIGVILVSIVGHLIRTYRWKLLLDDTGETNFWNLLFSLQLGYFVSLAIPRIGEFIKCFTSAETEKKSVSYVFGTVMSERIVDLIIMALLVGGAFLMDGDFISSFWATLKANMPEDSGTQKYFIIGLVVLVILVIYPMINKMTDGEKNEEQLMIGLKSAFETRNKVGFWVSSVLIWICYFFTSYLLFFSFSETSFLTLTDGYFTMLGGVVSRMLPINGGGIGAFHFVISNLLESFNVEAGVAASYALLNHGIQFIFQIVVGLVALIFLGSKIDLKKIKLKF